MLKNYDWMTLANKRKDYAEGELIVKQADVELTADEGAHEVVAVISTDSIDRDKEIVLPKGVDFTSFRKQPAVYLDHDTDTLPLGPCLWIKATDKAIIAKYKVVTEATELHKAVWELVKAGAMRSHSIGFISYNNSAPTSQELRYHPEWKGAKTVHRKSALLEFSLVGMPCNPDAVALAVSKGYSQETIQKLSGNSTKEGVAVATTEECKTEIKAYDVRRSFYQALNIRLNRWGK